MAVEIFIAVRDALIQILKDESTLAGSRVRLGRRLPLDNPYPSFSASEDTMPLIIVSMERMDFDNQAETGRRAQASRKVDFKAEGYVQSSSASAKSAGLTIDEHLDTQLDLLTSQISEAVLKYRTFRTTPSILNLRGQAEMWPTGAVKFEFSGDSAVFVGVISVSISAVYEQDRGYETLTNLEHAYRDLTANDDSDAKVIEVDVDY